MRYALAALLFIVVASACAGIVSKPVEYTADGIPFRGYLVYDDAVKGKRPGILVVHEWWGLNEYPRKRAEMLAKLGYVALAVDMYGGGKVVDNPADAGKIAGETMKNPESAKNRFVAALELLKKSDSVDPSRIGAIGYCFGGGVVLNMARAGVDLKGVVSFHGSLAAATKAEKGMVKAKILVCNGASDKFTSPEVIRDFKAEMNSARVDYQFINYANATHAFTNPRSTEVGKKFNMPIAYNARADKKSWSDMKTFFKNIFKD